MVSLVLLFNNTISFAKEKNITNVDPKIIKARTYETTKTDVVFNSVISSLEKEGYSITLKDDYLLYVSATKTTKVKDVSKSLIAAYVLKTGWDTAIAIVTYGIRSYNVAGDILLIKTEFKEKDFVQNIGVNIIPEKTQTTVKANIDEVLIGKRDGRPIGKKNKIKIVHTNEEYPYKLFFFRLNKQLEAQKIKRVTL